MYFLLIMICILMNPELIDCLDWLIIKLHGSVHFYPSSQYKGYKGYRCAPTNFYVDVGGSILGPHACASGRHFTNRALSPSSGFSTVLHVLGPSSSSRILFGLLKTLKKVLKYFSLTWEMNVKIMLETFKGGNIQLKNTNEK